MIEHVIEYTVDESVCDGLIKLYDTVEATGKACRPGTVGNVPHVNDEFKKCTDLFFNDIPKAEIEYSPEYKDMEYRAHLMECIKDYSERYLFWAPLGFHSHPKYQVYKPGEAFYEPHFDAMGTDQGRVVAWITYLNTVKEGGGTHFVYQDYTVQPIKGKTVLFPAGYTHRHKGVTAPKETKYIVTGWFMWEESSSGTK